MELTVGNERVAFRPWQPTDGQVFRTPFAFHAETTTIDTMRPWATPAYVLGAGFDGKTGLFVPRDRLPAFWATHADVPIACHEARFHLAVVAAAVPSVDVYDRVDRNAVYDTWLMHRLLALGANGHTAAGVGESTLDRCVAEHLGETLPKSQTDSQGRVVRLSFGRWLRRPSADIEPVYLDCLARVTAATFLLFGRLRAGLERLLAESGGSWGYVSPDWLAAQVQRWGWQTHHIQVRASIVLRAVTANGLTLDLDRRDELTARLQAEATRLREELRLHGYLAGQPGAEAALQSILRRLERTLPGVTFPRTAGGKYATSREALGEQAARVPFLVTLASYQAIESLLGGFVSRVRKRVVHPSFDPLVRSGRTSSFGELNAQNLPREHGVRACIVPSPGHVFISADYATIEMATLAQALKSQFGLDSGLARALNTGRDPHRMVAARMTGKPESEVTNDERQRAKPINFGKPGGMGLAAVRQCAKASYGVDLDDGEAQKLSDACEDEFPELGDFLRPESDEGEAVAQLFGLTPASHHAHTRCRRFLDHPENASRADDPHSILGRMCLKVLKSDLPTTRAGVPYQSTDVDYFWSRVKGGLDHLPDQVRQAVRDRRPSPALLRAVREAADRAPVFTVTGRLRAGASFPARRNTVFQGLAADGAKLALWLLWRAGFRVVNFVHDEVLIEVPASEDLLAKAEQIRGLMIDGMRQVVPDIRIAVEYAACDRWYKGAKAVRSPDEKRLELWTPPGA
ncbi:DNA polymerase [Fimbriiglobus ruber]|uniref:DNA-directed DNA polymerase n=1 Tax=Fimbriiglobus ruber TaxID=1908690 RepID=A0A225D8Y6_9BACT|nr:DNA polymerase [Fimbriiglobus ruber]OWK37433.1 DNA polymerase I [Fimbriiglobus ruber]